MNIYLEPSQILQIRNLLNARACDGVEIWTGYDRPEEREGWCKLRDIFDRAVPEEDKLRNREYEYKDEDDEEAAIEEAWLIMFETGDYGVEIEEVEEDD